MKIINADNFCLDYFNETVAIADVCPCCADKVAEFLNKTYRSEDSPTYFKVVPDDHKLQTFEEY